jgi:hypothetical protein
MSRLNTASIVLAVIAGVAAPVAVSQAADVQLKVTVTNLAPTNSISFAPFRFGVGNGTFDSFNNGAAALLLGFPSIADAPIVTVAEGGSGSNWFPAFSAAEPGANLGSVIGPGGPFLPGQSNSAVFTVNTANRFFTYGAMVVPSNDHFIGNDSPTSLQLFDLAGNLTLSSFTEKARDIWDAGSETQNAANAAFLVGGVNANRVDENGVVNFDFAGLNTFNGLQTAAGYTFDSSLLSANSDILRVTFEVVPEPASVSVLAGLATLVARRRRVG